MKLRSFHLLLSTIFLATTSDSKCVASELQRFTFTQPHMGAQWKIVLYAADETAANGAAEGAFARVAELNKILSDYDPESELSKLSATAGSTKPTKLSDDLWAVLFRSQKLAEQTGGAFDVTVGPLTKLWRRARRQREFPPAEMLVAAREATGYQNLVLDENNRTAVLNKPNMRLDLGGIGMGYAADEAMKVLKARGITSAMIDASGDILVSDAPPEVPGWRIGIVPGATGKPSQFVLLTNAALAVSGDAYQAVEIEGKRYSHIVNPKTGLGMTERLAVTVIADDCTTADSVATAVSVLGREAGTKFVEAQPNLAVSIHKPRFTTDGTTVIEYREVGDRRNIFNE